MEPAYPEHWEADVVLRDGGTCHLRPIRPDDADALVRFHARLSPETVYFRFFAPYPRLSDRDVQRFTSVDHRDRVALVATIGDDLIGVVRYDRLDADSAEVAFVIRDDHQGRGLGTVFLEHVAQAARERGISRFVAEVLPDNVRMLEVFRHAGYSSSTSVEEGVVMLELALDPTESSLAVSHAREQRAEAVSVERLLRPQVVAVVGAGRTPTSAGHAVLRHLLAGGFTGEVYPVNPHAETVAGLACWPSLDALPNRPDLVVVAVPAEAVADVVRDAAAVGAHGLLVVSSGFADTGPVGRDRQEALVAAARANGMRVVGPNALGMLNTDPAVSLNASLSPVFPGRGRIGFFSQSGALGVALLEGVVRRGLGLSTFVSAGNRSDVSGNDLLQYWADDPATDVVLLYLETVGNPRKFSRIVRRLAHDKPVVAVRSGGGGGATVLGRTPRRTALPPPAVAELFRQAGVIRTSTVSEMFDVAQLLSFQPLPRGRRVLTVGNSDALTAIAVDALIEYGLEPVDPPVVFPIDAAAVDYRTALAAAVDDPVVDAVLALFVPPLHQTGEEVAGAVAESASRATTPVAAVLFGVEDAATLLRRPTTDGVAGPGSVPTFPSVEDAVRALAAVADFGEWKAAPVGRVPDLADVDPDAARQLVEQALADLGPDGGQVRPDVVRRVLRFYGIEVWPRIEVHDADAAVSAARSLGFPAVLKTVWSQLRLRSDLGGIWFDLADEDAVRRAFGQAQAELSRLEIDRYVVQRQAAAGVSVVLSSQEDPLFGPVVSFGVAGMAHDVLDDRSHRVAPFTDEEARALVAAPKAARLLASSPGIEPLALDALHELVQRLGRLADDLPEVAHLRLRPVVVSPSGVSVLGARARLAPAAVRTDLPARRLLG